MTGLAQLEAFLRDLVRSEVRAALAEQRAPSGLVSIATFAAQRSISPSTVRKAIRESRLQATRVGRAVRIAADATIAAGSARTPTSTARAEARLGIVRGGSR